MPTISFQPDRGTFTHSRLNSSGGLQVEIQFRGRASSVKSIANIRWNIQPALNLSKTIRVFRLRIYPASLISEFRIGVERGKPKGSDFVFSHLLSCSHSQLPHSFRALWDTPTRKNPTQLCKGYAFTAHFPDWLKLIERRVEISVLSSHLDILSRFIHTTSWYWLSGSIFNDQFSAPDSLRDGLIDQYSGYWIIGCFNRDYWWLGVDSVLLAVALRASSMFVCCSSGWV